MCEEHIDPSLAQSTVVTVRSGPFQAQRSHTKREMSLRDDFVRDETAPRTIPALSVSYHPSCLARFPLSRAARRRLVPPSAFTVRFTPRTKRTTSGAIYPGAVASTEPNTARFR